MQLLVTELNLTLTQKTMKMPIIYKVRNDRKKTQWFMTSYSQARKMMLKHGEEVRLEKLEYKYKWQLVVMLSTAYNEGRNDVSFSLD
jgi:hypothetical protein